jgi:hypothetical protein
MSIEELSQNILSLKSNAKEWLDHIDTEETTKMSLISPFIRALGYKTEDPRQVVAEFTADVIGKKGEKIDYALKKNGKVIIVIEAKKVGTDLKNVHASQLDRYFNCLDCRFGILTNGVDYHFYSDLEKTNKMDKYPFFTFNLFNNEDRSVKELSKFTYSSFDEDSITQDADRLKYIRTLKGYLKSNYDDLKEDFFKFMFSQVYSQKVSSWSNMQSKYREVVQEAFKQFINDEVRKKLKNALGDSENSESSNDNKSSKSSFNKQPDIDVTKDKNILFIDEEKGIVTTVEEVEAYHIIKAVLRNEVEADKVIMRDTKSYCGILFDDNNRKPIARLYFNSSQKYLATLDADKKETKHPIEKLEDIYNYSEQIKTVVKNYL